MSKWGSRVVPHAFVVDQGGTIIWHGQINRKGLIEATKTVMTAAATPTLAQKDGGAKAEPAGKQKSGKKKPLKTD